MPCTGITMSPNSLFAKVTHRLFAAVGFAILPFATLGLATLFGLTATVHAEDAADNSHAKYMGTGSCSSSNCHGSVAPRAGGNILFTEYVTWERHDKHAQAYKVLSNQQSVTIAKHLGIKNAEESPLCLGCHATTATESRRGAKYQREDGVSCESCHGAAENWLSGHAERGANHKDNVANGMVDLVRVDVRSKHCLTCHHGAEDKAVDHRLIGAGHPRLAFELDTFENILPRHWELDSDYAKRKFDYRPSSAWLTAQTVTAQEQLAKVLSPKRSHEGVFPEFTMYYCYACHHSLEGEQYKSRDYNGHPGEPRLNLASAMVVREALRVVNPKLGDALGEQIRSVEENYPKGNGEASVRALKTLLADRILPNTYEDFSQNDRKRILRQLASYAANTPFLPYEVGEQVAMGIVSIAADLQLADGALKGPIDTLYNSLAKEKSFMPEEFTKAAQVLTQRLGKGDK